MTGHHHLPHPYITINITLWISLCQTLSNISFFGHHKSPTEVSIIIFFLTEEAERSNYPNNTINQLYPDYAVVKSKKYKQTVNTPWVTITIVHLSFVGGRSGMALLPVLFTPGSHLSRLPSLGTHVLLRSSRHSLSQPEASHSSKTDITGVSAASLGRQHAVCTQSYFLPKSIIWDTDIYFFLPWNKHQSFVLT